jgi:hypothetical protein
MTTENSARPESDGDASTNTPTAEAGSPTAARDASQKVGVKIQDAPFWQALQVYPAAIAHEEAKDDYQNWALKTLSGMSLGNLFYICDRLNVAYQVEAETPQSVAWRLSVSCGRCRCRTVSEPLTQRALGLEVQPAPRQLCHDPADPGRAPHIRFAFAVASEQSDQADGVQTVCLGTPGATIHLDTRRVDDHIVDTVMMQTAMEPEAVASGLVAGEDHSALRNAEPGFGASDLPQDGRGIPGLHRHNTSPLATGSGRGQLPLTGAQLESNVEHRRKRGGRIEIVSR